ncbi:MAG: dihydroorotate dehydrogenase [Thermoplasmata archaeon]|nr:dihydroorotate dehydrogenase [Thermoplasmata archaeon]
MIEDVSLEVEVGGVRLSHPVLLASGVLNETAHSMIRVVDVGGAAGVVTKSISLDEKMGHRNPTVVELPTGLLNSMGVPNPGMEEYSKEVLMFKERLPQTPIILSLYGESVEEFEKLARAAKELPVEAVEVNLSCPNREEGGLTFGTRPEMVYNAVRAVRRGFPRGVWVKLTAQVGDVVEVAKEAQRAGADALVAINTLKGMAIDPLLAMPVLANKTGGYSGPGIKPVALRVVWELSSSEEIYIPVVGVGGIETGIDAVEFMMAGASAVEVGSAVRSRGIEVFRAIMDEIRMFLIENGYSSVKEIIGLALDVEKAMSREEVI